MSEITAQAALAATQGPKTSAVEYLEDIPLGNQMEPTGLDGMYRLATILSRAKLIPDHFKGDPASTMLVMMQARQIGVPVVSATQTCYVISGKVGWASVVLQALAKRSPRCKKFYLKSVDQKRAVMVVQTTEMDEPVEVEYTIDMAQRAGLISRNKGTWEGSTEDMLVARVGSKAARRYFPEELVGIYSVEELREIPVDPEAPVIPKGKTKGAVLLDALAAPVVAETKSVEPEPEGEAEPVHQAELLPEEGDTEAVISAEIAGLIRETAKKVLGKFGGRMLDAEVKRRWDKTVEDLTPSQSDEIDEWIAETKRNAGA